MRTEGKTKKAVAWGKLVDFSKCEFLSPSLFSVVMHAGEEALRVRRDGLTAEIKTSKENLVTEGDKIVTITLKLNLNNKN